MRSRDFIFLALLASVAAALFLVCRRKFIVTTTIKPDTTWQEKNAASGPAEGPSVIVGPALMEIPGIDPCPAGSHKEVDAPNGRYWCVIDGATLSDLKNA